MRIYHCFVIIVSVHPMVIIGTNFDPSVGLGIAIDFHLCAFGKGIVVSEPPALTKSALACVSVPSIYPLDAHLKSTNRDELRFLQFA
jgi:hypothetical protein